MQSFTMVPFESLYLYKTYHPTRDSQYKEGRMGKGWMNDHEDREDT